MSLWYNSRQLFCDFSSKHYPSSSTSRGEDSTAVPKKWNWPTIKRRQTRTQSRNFYWRPRITSKTTDHSIVQAARDFWSSQVQLPSQTGSDLASDKLLRALSSQGLKISRDRDGKTSPATLLGCPHGEKDFFLISSLNLSCFNLWILSLILPPHTVVKSLAPSSWWPPCRY